MIILLIEDDRTSRAIVERHLSSYAKIEVAATLKDGLQKAGSGRYDLIVSDCNLPGAPADRAATVLAVRDAAPSTMIYAITSTPTQDLIDRLAERSIRVFDKADVMTLADAVAVLHRNLSGDRPASAEVSGLTRQQVEEMIAAAQAANFAARDHKIAELFRDMGLWDKERDKPNTSWVRERKKSADDATKWKEWVGKSMIGAILASIAIWVGSVFVAGLKGWIVTK